MKTKIHIGLNVHKNSIAPPTPSPTGRNPQNSGKWGGSNLAAGCGLLKLMKKLGVTKAEVRSVFGCGDVHRGAAAWIVWHRSSAPQAWIAQRLGLRSAANVSQQRRWFDSAAGSELPADVRR